MQILSLLLMFKALVLIYLTIKTCWLNQKSQYLGLKLKDQLFVQNNQLNQILLLVSMFLSCDL